MGLSLLAQVNLPDNFGATALFYAAFLGRDQMVSR
jgi:hypothetical protein